MQATRPARAFACALLLLAAAIAGVCASASGAISHRKSSVSGARHARIQGPHLDDRVAVTDSRRRHHRKRHRSGRRRHKHRNAVNSASRGKESPAPGPDTAEGAPAGRGGGTAPHLDSGPASGPGGTLTPPLAEPGTPPSTGPETPADPPPPVQPIPTSGCFQVPSACGYPDPTTAGVPAGTTLTPSGSIVVNRPGTVVSGVDVTGTIQIEASDVTIEDSRVTQTSSCGPTNACGNYTIGIAWGLTGIRIRHVESRTTAGRSCQQDIRNTGSEVTIEAAYLHACDGNVYAAGPTLLKDSYGVARIDISTDHIENIYFNETSFTAVHDTLFNPVNQTAVIFGNSGGGIDVTNCSNQLTVRESLLAGGGYTLYPCAHSSQPGSSTLTVEGNHFARCLTASIYEANGGHHPCSGGFDTNGYYPNSGSYGIASDYYPGTGTWRGNVWDDNLRKVCIDGASSGCE